MKIIMAGIDHSKASVEIREIFALTKAAHATLMNEIIKSDFVEGCVIINTCNRMEIWISYTNVCTSNPYEMLCEIKKIDSKKFASYFTIREGMTAVEHLFELSCGLKSKVFGEEQIITQVRDSIDFARQNKTSDPVLESLFRSAVTAAKKVKTQVRLIAVNRSLGATSVELLKDHYQSLSTLNCLIIGNGEIGRLTASLLIDEGCKVTMTLRQYKHNTVLIPTGCDVIPYEDKIKYLNEANVIISATSSPHFTLHFEDVKTVLNNDPKIFIDLAVPRDIDPNIADLKQVSLYDIDDFGGSMIDENSNAGIIQAKEILNDALQDFEKSYYFRYLVPKINQISEIAAENIENRIKDQIQALEIKQEQQNSLRETVNKAAYKVVEKMMFGFKEDMNRSMWEECLKSIEKAVSK